MKQKKHVTNRRTGFTVLAALVALSFCAVVPDAQGVNIIFVTNNTVTSQPFQDFLTSEGHVLTVDAYTAGPPDSATLAANDLIILTRESNSGDYDESPEPADWNTLSLPIINMSPYHMRTSRWGWFNGTSVSGSINLDSFDTFPNSSHPFVAGASEQFLTAAFGNVQGNVTNALPAGTTVVATLNSGAGYGIVDYPAGTTLFPDAQATVSVTNAEFVHVNFGSEGAWANIGPNGEQIMRNIIGALTSTNKAHTPDPANGATLVSVDSTVLSWEAPDDPNVPVTYDVYFGTTVPDGNCDGPPLASADQAATTYDPGTMAFNTNYYWRVDVRDPNGGGTPIIVKGDCWTFKTAPQSVLITSDPAGLTVDKGATAVFTVGQVNGESFQWKKDGVNVSNGGKYSGADTDTLTITDVQVAEEGNYSCMVSNTAPSSQTSAEAQLITCRLVGHWKLDGDLTDSVQDTEAGVPTHDGSLASTSIVFGEQYVTGVFGQAYDFEADPNTADPNSNSNYILIDGGDNPNAYFNFMTRGFSVSFWVQDATVTSWEGLFTKQTVDQSAGWFIDVSPPSSSDPEFRNREGVAVGSGVSVFDPASHTNALDPNWHHVVAVFDPTAGEARIYQNGVLEGTDTSVGAADTTSTVAFGVEAEDGQDAFDGLLDDVRVYSCPLSGTDVALLYTAGADGYICVDDGGELAGFDHNGDCIVNLLDYADWVANFLNCNRIPVSTCP